MNLDAIFKAYDVRGKVPAELNTDTTKVIGQALAQFLPAGTVAVGRDMRVDSQELAGALIAGLTQSGREVWDIGQVTTDMIYFAVGNFSLVGGAMVTASHNPGEYNGIKLCREQARPIGVETGLLDIKKMAEDGKFTDASGGKVDDKDVSNGWVEHALSFVDTSKWPDYKVAIDTGNGMAGAIIPKLERKVPLEITPLFFELDGTFPNHPADPINPDNLKDLVTTVANNKLDFGIAFDGDGDRAFLVDELGQPVGGSIMCALLAEHFLKTNPGATILHNAICSRVVAETIMEHGGKPVRTRVGHSYIKADMAKYEAPFAGEHSGHYYFKNNWRADSGLIAALVAIDVLAQSGLKLSELAGKYRIYKQSGEINFEVTDKEVALAKLVQEFSDGKQDELDGLSVNYKNWWFNVRPSNTEPLLRLNVEADSQDELEERVKQITKIITT